MENLLSSLERILDVWRQDREEILELVRPGITEQELQDAISNLPLQLPQEVHWLYKWRDGITIPKYYDDRSLDFLPGFWFRSLAETIKEYERIEEFRQGYTGYTPSKEEHGDKPWFPIFCSDIGYFIVFGDNDVNEVSPVHYLSWRGGNFVNRVQYPSLATMMSVIAECYESGAYYLEMEGRDEFGTPADFLKEDQKKVDRIRRKHSLSSSTL